MSSLRFATWNLAYRGLGRASLMAELLAEHQPDIALLQEANPGSLAALCEGAGFEWAITAFDAGAPVTAGATGRRRVSAIAARGIALDECGVLPGVALPERAVWARLRTEPMPISVIAYHAPPGVSWGITKVHHAHAPASWCRGVRGPVIVGADANTPEVDHPDPIRTRTHWHTGSRRLGGMRGDDIVFGGRPEHGLADALRLWLRDHPEQLSRIKRERPDGPLAVSHRTGRRRDRPGIDRRFDIIQVSGEFAVRRIEYLLDDALRAGSDHALVIADLELRPAGR